MNSWLDTVLSRCFNRYVLNDNRMDGQTFLKFLNLVENTSRQLSEGRAEGTALSVASVYERSWGSSLISYGFTARVIRGSVRASRLQEVSKRMQ